MFGVLECENEAGEVKVLRAFSSLAGGIRTVPGWVPSVLDDAVFYKEVFPGQQEIKAMTAEMNQFERDSPAYREVFERRKTFSQNLMREIHDLYAFTNFKGETRPLRDVFLKPNAIPGGVGDCCGTKAVESCCQEWPQAAWSRRILLGWPKWIRKEATRRVFLPVARTNASRFLGLCCVASETHDAVRNEGIILSNGCPHNQTNRGMLCSLAWNQNALKAWIRPYNRIGHSV